MEIIYLLGSLLSAIVFFFIGKMILNINTRNVERQLTVQNKLLALIAKQQGVAPEDIKVVLNSTIE